MATPRQAESIEHITLDEAARRLGVHPKTVYRMQLRGELPTVYLGHQRFTSAEGVDAVLTPPDPIIVRADGDAVVRASARFAKRQQDGDGHG